jgi:hypothetical protein
MVGIGSRSSFEWWYFQEDWSSFEFSFVVNPVIELVRIGDDTDSSIPFEDRGTFIVNFS